MYTFFYQEKEPGFLFAGERHSVVELIYVDQGQLHSVADGRDILLSQGELALYAPDQWHMQYADADCATSYITITFIMINFYRKNISTRYCISKSIYNTNIICYFFCFLGFYIFAFSSITIASLQI